MSLLNNYDYLSFSGDSIFCVKNYIGVTGKERNSGTYHSFSKWCLFEQVISLSEINLFGEIFLPEVFRTVCFASVFVLNNIS